MSATLHIFSDTTVTNLTKTDENQLNSDSVVEEIYRAIIDRLRTTRITHPDRPNQVHWFILTGLLAIIYGRTSMECDGPVLWALKDSLRSHGQTWHNGFDPKDFRPLIEKIEETAIKNLQKFQTILLIPSVPTRRWDHYESYDLLVSEDENEPCWTQIIVTGFAARECKVKIEIDPIYNTEKNQQYLKQRTVGGLIPLYELQPPRCYRG